MISIMFAAESQKAAAAYFLAVPDRIIVQQIVMYSSSGCTSSTMT